MRLTLRSFLVAILIALVLVPLMATAAFAQAPAEDTPTSEPPATFTPTPTPTDTLVPTDTPTATPPLPTEVVPTETPTAIPVTPSPTPEPEPIPIPEPITTVLFGTGLAAISAAIAARRRKK